MGIEIENSAHRIALIAALGAAVAGAFFLLPQQHATAAAALTETYRDDQHGFSLQYPDGYMATATATEDPDIYFIDLQKPGANIQITITSAPDDGSILTTENVVSDYPYVADIPTEPFTVAPDVVGLAFNRQPDMV